MNDSDRIMLGIPRTLKVRRDLQSHANNGGSRGYPLEFRQLALQMQDQGVNITSDSSIRRWRKRILPHKATGNKRQYSLSGEYQRLLIIFRTVYPKAVADEIRVFIANNSSDHRVFSRDQIYKAEQRLLMLDDQQPFKL